MHNILKAGNRCRICLLLVTSSCVPVTRVQHPAPLTTTVRISYVFDNLLDETILTVPSRPVIPFASAPPFTRPSDDPSQIEKGTECLAAAGYYEARSEGEEGQRAVVQVVLNRVRHYAFPSTICGVVYQRTRGGVCQFSFTCDGSMKRRREPQAWSVARRIATEALGGRVYEKVGLSTRFHAAYVRPAWSKTLPRVARVGMHIFYLEHGSGGALAAFVRQSSSLEFARASPAS